MTSWMIEESGHGLNRDHRFKGFHKSNFSEPTRVKPDSNRHNNRHGLVQHFVEPGIETKGERNQLAYGSDTKYSYEQKRASFSEELEKKKKQQREFEDFVEAHKQQKAYREATIAEQKRKDLEMLQKYQPWGQPSGGAPRVGNDGERDTRRHRIEWESTSRTDKHLDEDYDQSLPFGKPGNGAPRRTESGKLHTAIASDPTIRFQRNFKKDVDHVLRYRSPEKAREYAQSLEKQVLEQYPKERHPFPYQDSDYHPYGKPGSGAPLRGHNGRNGLVASTKNQFEDNDQDTDEKREKTLRYARRLEQQRIEAMTRKAKEVDESKQPTSFYPWEKSHPRRDSSGNVARHRQTLRSKIVSDFDDESATRTTPKARLTRTFGIHGDGTVLDPSTVTHAEEEPFNPWGRPGGGAPIMNESGKVVTATQQHFNGKKQQTEKLAHSPRNTSDVVTERLGMKRQLDANSREYHNELERQAELRYNQKQRDKAEDQRLALEHATRETQLWGTNPNPDPIRRVMVDPTEVQSKKEKATFYHSELTELANRRYEEKKQLQNQNFMEDQQHLSTFSNQWGRPGGGAPRKDELGRLDAARRFGLLEVNTSVRNKRRS